MWSNRGLIAKIIYTAERGASSKSYFACGISGRTDGEGAGASRGTSGSVLVRMESLVLSTSPELASSGTFLGIPIEVMLPFRLILPTPLRKVVIDDCLDN